MNLSIDKTLANRLKSMYSDDEAARRLFLWFDDRKKDSWEMPVRVAAQRTELPEREVRRVFKEFADLGCGTFIKGRGEGAETRMKWTLSIRSIAAAAKGEIIKIDVVTAASKEETLEAEEAKINTQHNDEFTHTFRLRPDFDVAIKLPFDLTAREAERLGVFIKAIPLGD